MNTLRILNRSLLSLAFILLAAQPAWAQTSLVVTNLNNTGAGSLRTSIETANSTPGPVNITFQAGLSGTINLTSMLPMVRNASGVSINGAGATITLDGGSSSNTTGDRILFFGVKGSDGTALTATDSTTWTVANLTLQNGNARGGAGGIGSSLSGGWSGGGGGAGMGGAVFVNAGSATLTNVTLLNNRAVGGAGGSLSAGIAEGGTGGGGGMGGIGGNGGFYDAGGGGGFGLGANGGIGGASGSAGQYFGGASTQAGAGSGATGGTGGLSGGGGGGSSNNQNGGGGGAGGMPATASGPPGGSGKGGDGGFGGGGGGGGGNTTQTGGRGGYGGGGGGAGAGGGGAGGFGGGGGGGASGGTADFGGGSGSGGYQGGGGGAGLGGAVFVRQGASLIISGGSFTGGTVAGGVGANGGASGSGGGSAVFLAGSMECSVANEQTVTISNTIGGGTNALITGGFTKSGPGTLILGGDNNYTGQTSITSGTLEVGSTAGRLSGTSSVSINGGTLRLSGGAAVTDRINNGASMSLSGTFNTGGLSDTIGALTLSGNSTLDLGSGSSIFRFGDSSGSAWTPATLLTITNWSGSFNGGGTDQLFFGTGAGGLGSSQLSQVRFDMGGGSFSSGKMLGGGELVPVPEPGAVLAALLLLAPAAWRERRWFLRCRDC